MPQFELVIPAYNEAKNLPTIVSRAVEACQKYDFSPVDFQLVIVNNGSTDETSEVLTTLKSSNHGPYFRVVVVEVNQGYGHGIYSGLKSTTAPIVGWTHADMQCDPDDAFRALDFLKTCSGKSLVKGHRSGRNWKDRLVTRGFEFSARILLGTDVDEINAQPKVFSRELLAEIKHPPTGIAFDLYVLYIALRNGYQIDTIDVLLPPRIHGVSKWASNFISRAKTMAKVLKDISLITRHEGRL